MSYFDGIIPPSCGDCFHLDGKNWVPNDPGLCDACAFALDMFPVIRPGGGPDYEKLQLLEIMEPPVWKNPYRESSQ